MLTRMQKEQPVIRTLLTMIVCALGLIFALYFSPAAQAANSIRLVIDGQRVADAPPLLLRDGRTLVPLRFVSEQLGGRVNWDRQRRTVHIAREDLSVLLRIDSHLVSYGQGNSPYQICDVPPRIIDGLTYVPLRLVGNALGAAVSWEASSATVMIDSAAGVDIRPFYDFRFAGMQAGQTIGSTTSLQLLYPGQRPAATEIRFLLLDPTSGMGTVVARGEDSAAAYSWLPDLSQEGNKLLAAALFDSGGKFLGGTVVAVRIENVREVTLTGVSPGQLIRGAVELSCRTSFSAAYVRYEVIDQAGETLYLSPETDPLGVLTWMPQVEHNGLLQLRVTAYAADGQFQASPAITVVAATEPRVELLGVTAATSPVQPIQLQANGNFAIRQTEYVLRNPLTGREEVLASLENEPYSWFPAAGDSGSRELLVRVWDAAGNSYSSRPVRVDLKGAVQLILSGIGPDQVVTGPLTLKIKSNTPLEDIRLVLVNRISGAGKTIAASRALLAEYPWSPTAGGAYRLYAEGRTTSGQTVRSVEIPFRVYLGRIYPAQPIVAKDQFQALASGYAVASQRQTGMSAALQTAQAILETGWGQSVPVDKYSGQKSNNLFGIKGSGPNGSVISNTWEEYMGTAYRIDARFRAYRDPAQSWQDHKAFLLQGARYLPFRQVMHDSVQGAWALKRCGYATDSRYPLKLMDLINRYQLDQLDQVGI